MYKSEKLEIKLIKLIVEQELLKYMVKPEDFIKLIEPLQYLIQNYEDSVQELQDIL